MLTIKCQSRMQWIRHLMHVSFSTCSSHQSINILQPQNLSVPFQDLVRNARFPAFNMSLLCVMLHEQQPMYLLWLVQLWWMDEGRLLWKRTCSLFITSLINRQTKKKMQAPDFEVCRKECLHKHRVWTRIHRFRLLLLMASQHLRFHHKPIF